MLKELMDLLKSDPKPTQVTEGAYVVKNKDGVEKRFKDHTSSDAQAWKASSKAKAAEQYSDEWWKGKADNSSSSIITPYLAIGDGDESAINALVKKEYGKTATDWHVTKKGSMKKDGTTCAMATVRVALHYSKDDDLGLDHDTEDGAQMKIVRDRKSPKTFNIVSQS